MSTLKVNRITIISVLDIDIKKCKWHSFSIPKLPSIAKLGTKLDRGASDAPLPFKVVKNSYNKRIKFLLKTYNCL